MRNREFSRRLIRVCSLVVASLLPIHVALARGGSPTPSSSPTPSPTPPKCVANYCGPVCEFPQGVDYGQKPPDGGWPPVTYGNITVTVRDTYSFPPRNSLYICMDLNIGSNPIPNPNELLVLRRTFTQLRDTAQSACTGEWYCNADGAMSYCKFDYEMRDPDRVTPPDFRQDPASGDWIAHGCMEVTCNPGDPGPIGCNDWDDSNCDICNEDGSCSHDCSTPTPTPTPPGGGRDPTPTPSSPPPSGTPQPTSSPAAW